MIPARVSGPPARAVARITASALGPYQTAVLRIGISATWLCFLLREWPHRHELYGPDSPWGWDMARQLVEGNGAFTALLWSDDVLWFEAGYLFSVVSSALLLLGWRTRTVSVLFMAGVLSLQNRSIFMGDGGDNVIHLMAVYLVLTRCARVWSLDARRARVRAAAHGADHGQPPHADATGVVLWSVLGLALTAVTLGPGLGWGWALVFWGLWAVQALWWALCRYAPDREPRAVADIVANLVHNGALLVIMAEVCLIYATAGWYKVQGSRWQDGTALHYPLHLDYFTPWPGLSELVSSSGLLVMLITYGTVITQVAFPFTLFNRRVKNVLLVVMIAEHLSIAVLLGLPFFSLAMVAVDAVFLPTGFLRGLGRYARRGTARLRLPGQRGGAGRGDAERDGDGRGRPRTLVG
ncbi:MULTISPECIES: HTTM domain-containing protein [Streptomyces]|uniref:HTTM domain-containing protein n=1 Tax=Streptomyces lycii TaxID=2654337 RepID=A0ABQ7FIS7_9ACTN|nr:MULTISPECIES: HTTM domain-containing protein [Streptomyces]KAF4408275.1 HTTM domain-containing protein [Streptomyces lycii]PGH47411.1 hypothetical protein CRI70_28605 [Streptomyces sp. Ru87]